jgi:hypothetical protein
LRRPKRRLDPGTRHTRRGAKAQEESLQTPDLEWL